MEDAATNPPSRVGRYAAVLAGLLTAGLLMPMPDIGDLGTTLLDMLHAPLFAMLGYFGYRLLRKRLTPANGATWGSAAIVHIVVTVVVWIALVIFGAATEYAQKAIGRTASQHDLLCDAVGAAFGIAWAIFLYPPRWRSRIGFAAMTIVTGIGFAAINWNAIVIVVDTALRPFDGPRLATFEKSRERTRWRGHQAKYRRVTEFATEGQHSLQVVLEPGQYPFLSLRRLEPDWTPYQSLTFDILIERPTRLFVKVQDRPYLKEYDDLFAREFQFTPGAHHVQIRLDDIARAPLRGELDMTDIGLLQFQVINTKEKTVFYLDNIQLE